VTIVQSVAEVAKILRFNQTQKSSRSPEDELMDWQTFQGVPVTKKTDFEV
jgi:hypothetical protein